MAQKIAPVASGPKVIADASPIIGLSLIDGLGWLKPLFGVVFITRQVRDEILHNYDADPKPGMAQIADAIDAGVIKAMTRDWHEPQFTHLDEGEASVLRAAAHQRAKCLVIIDEALGRRAAMDMGIAVTGLVGIIIAAKKKRLIRKIAPPLARLGDVGFRLSPVLVAEALVIAGENTP